MTLNADTLLVLPRRSASVTTNLLSQKGWMYRTEHVDPWFIITISSNMHPETVHGNNALYWTEIGCLGADTVTAERLDGVAAPHQSSEDILIPAEILFRNGIKFEGLTISTNRISRGRTMNISYFWYAPSGIHPGDWAVFVHFECGDSRFQDDHVFLAREPLEYIRTQPVPVLFREEDHVSIPPDVPTGEYTVWVGMYDRKTGIRIVPSTALQVDHNKVKLPVSLHLD